MRISNILKSSALAVLLTGVTAPALAHGGRRFEVQIINLAGQDTLVAQGYNSTGADDGGGVIRPYLNAIHNHWSNSPGASTAASATLPGFDIPNGITALQGYDLTWELTGAWKWTTPSMAGTVTETALDPADTIFATRGGTTVSTNTPGELLLTSYDGTNGDDLDLVYDIDLEPNGVLYVLESILKTNAPGIANSSTIYTIFAPDPTSPNGGLHHTALNLESQRNLTIPEPGALSLISLGGLALLRRRRA